MIFHKIKNYKNFLLEIIAVFIGISASFWLDDYKVNWEEKKLANKYYAGFIADFEKDEEQLIEILTLRKSQLNSSKAILDLLEKKEIDVDSFYYHFYNVFPVRGFLPNTNTIEEMLNTSHLRLISNDTLKNNILELRSKYKLVNGAEDHIYQDRSAYLYTGLTLNHIELDGIELYMNKNSFASDKFADTYKADIEYFRNDRYFKNFLNLLNFNLEFLIPLTEEVREDCKSIIGQIKMEIQ